MKNRNKYINPYIKLLNAIVKQTPKKKRVDLMFIIIMKAWVDMPLDGWNEFWNKQKA